MQSYSQQQINSLLKRQIAFMALVVPTLIIIITGCNTQTFSNNNPQPTSSSQVSIENIPSPLKIALIVNMNEAQRQEQQRAFTEYLNKTLKRPVSLEAAKDYNHAVDLLVEEKVQVARLRPLTYIEAKQRNPQIEPIDALNESNHGRSYEEIKANPNRITISTSLEDKYVKVAIADNGKGMPEDVKQRIFDHLFTTKGVGKGTGLGLAIARQIVVEKHGGSLEIQSQVEQGATFTIWLPI